MVLILPQSRAAILRAVDNWLNDLEVIRDIYDSDKFENVVACTHAVKASLALLDKVAPDRAVRLGMPLYDTVEHFASIHAGRESKLVPMPKKRDPGRPERSGKFWSTVGICIACAEKIFKARKAFDAQAKLDDVLSELAEAFNAHDINNGKAITTKTVKAWRDNIKRKNGKQAKPLGQKAYDHMQSKLEERSLSAERWPNGSWQVVSEHLEDQGYKRVR